MKNEDDEETPEKKAAGLLIDGQAQTEGIPAQPENRRVNRPAQTCHEDYKESGVKFQRRQEITSDRLARTACPPAAQARPTRQLMKDTSWQLVARLKPRPSQKRPPEENQRPDELVIEFTRKGRPTDDTDSHKPERLTGA